MNSSKIKFGEYNAPANRLPVYLDGKQVGDIRDAIWGWTYSPKVEVDGHVWRLFSNLTKLKAHLRETL